MYVRGERRPCCRLYFLRKNESLRIGLSGSRTRDGELALTLQESSVGVDELVRLDIANGDTGHVGGICRDRSRRGGGCAGEVVAVVQLKTKLDMPNFCVGASQASSAGDAGARSVTFRRTPTKGLEVT